MSNAEKARLLANLRGVAEQASTSSQAQNISDTFNTADYVA